MLTLLADQPECLWGDALPVKVKELPTGRRRLGWTPRGVATPG